MVWKKVFWVLSTILVFLLIFILIMLIILNYTPKSESIASEISNMKTSSEKQCKVKVNAIENGETVSDHYPIGVNCTTVQDCFEFMREKGTSNMDLVQLGVRCE